LGGVQALSGGDISGGGYNNSLGGQQYQKPGLEDLRKRRELPRNLRNVPNQPAPQNHQRGGAPGGRPPLRQSQTDSNQLLSNNYTVTRTERMELLSRSDLMFSSDPADQKLDNTNKSQKDEAFGRR
jgi:hypothetical protein